MNNNHPISNLWDTAHLAGKKLFSKLDWPQTYHCLQMAYQRSLEFLVFSFASRTFAYDGLAQGLSRVLSAFSSFMREYLDSDINADQCAKNVRKASGKRQERKTETDNPQMPFRSNRSWIPWKNHHARQSSPGKSQGQKFPRPNPLAQVKETSAKYLGFVNYYRTYIPWLSETLIGMYDLLKADTKITISQQTFNDFNAITASLAEACGLALRHSVAGKQYVLMTHASVRASGYAWMIEDNKRWEKTTIKRKIFCNSGVRIPRILNINTKVDNILQRMFSNISRFLRI